MPIVRLDRSSLRALAYAASLGQPVLAVHISPSDDEAARFNDYWAAWGDLELPRFGGHGWIRRSHLGLVQ